MAERGVHGDNHVFERADEFLLLRGGKLPPGQADGGGREPFVVEEAVGILLHAADALLFVERFVFHDAHHRVDVLLHLLLRGVVLRRLHHRRGGNQGGKHGCSVHKNAFLFKNGGTLSACTAAGKGRLKNGIPPFQTAFATFAAAALACGGRETLSCPPVFPPFQKAEQ